MKRAILLLAGFACCSGLGCDTQTTAKLILTVGLNARAKSIAAANGAATAGADVVVTSDHPTSRMKTALPVDELVAAMQDFTAPLNQAGGSDAELATHLNALLDRIAKSATAIENASTASAILVQQAREARAIALERAAELLPAEFAGCRDTYCEAAFGPAWDRAAVEQQAINRLVSGYLVAAELPADVSHVLSLHAVTFPNSSMNVDLYTTLAERLTGEGDLRGGLELARAGLRLCANHADVSRLQERVKQIYREHPGQVGVPMNFAGPTLRERRFVLNSLQGRPVLVVFWSQDEPAASEFMDRCLKLARSHAETELEVVGVNLGADLKAAELWLVERGFPCRQVFSTEKGHAGLENPIARFFGVTALPELFLLDREGIVIVRGADQLDTVEAQLRQLAPPRLARAD